MKITFQDNGKPRKQLITALGIIVNDTHHYSGAPKFEYSVGPYMVDRAGALTGPDNRELVAALAEQGFVPEEETYDVPEVEAGL